MEVWRANMDFRLTLDFGKVIGYITKYVTKQESISKAGTQRMIRNILNQSIENGKLVHHPLKKTMGKLNGERMMSRQETSHLIQGLPLVSCSHSFAVVHMKTLSTKIQKPDEQADAATLKSISELYGERMSTASWMNKSKMQAFQDERPLLPMSFHEFAGTFYVGQRGHFQKKLLCHQKKVVTKFTPKLSCDPAGKKYAEYCRYALIKYRPWEGSIDQ
jgi:transcriptional regulator with GAF, ATPase, and Fis domain